MKNDVLSYIFERDPMQKKKVLSFFERCSEAKDDLEVFFNTYGAFFKKAKFSVSQLGEAYLWLNAQMMYSRLEFVKTGKYPATVHSEVDEQVYQSVEVMTKYMLGVALSQYLWEHHYRILQFYRESISQVGGAKNFMEIGCGHGIFLWELLKAKKVYDLVHIVDISSVSLGISKGIIDCLEIDSRDKLKFMECDINNYSPAVKYDFINMGEVLEHVENPGEILKSVHSMLSDSGKLNLSTCINCPTIDHLYHFKCVKEIKKLLDEAGFTIKRDILIPSENKSKEYIEKFKVDVSYVALVEKNNCEA